MSTEWKMVPVEPTDAMLCAMVNIPVHGRAWGIDAVGLQRVWAAMLSAAPSQPAAQPEQPEPGVLTDERIAEISTFATGWVSPPTAFFSLARAIEREVLSTRRLSDEQVARVMKAVQFYGDQRAIDAYCRGFNEPDDPSGKTLAALSEVERPLRGEA